MKTLRQLIDDYKVSLDTWVMKAKNDRPPSEQYKQIMKEIDDEFISSIRQLVDEAVPHPMNAAGRSAVDVMYMTRDRLKDRGLL